MTDSDLICEKKLEHEVPCEKSYELLYTSRVGMRIWKQKDGCCMFECDSVEIPTNTWHSKDRMEFYSKEQKRKEWQERITTETYYVLFDESDNQVAETTQEMVAIEWQQNGPIKKSVMGILSHIHLYRYISKERKVIRPKSSEASLTSSKKPD